MQSYNAIGRFARLCVYELLFFPIQILKKMFALKTIQKPKHFKNILAIVRTAYERVQIDWQRTQLKNQCALKIILLLFLPHTREFK
jgi:hypothetical protein